MYFCCCCYPVFSFKKQYKKLLRFSLDSTFHREREKKDSERYREVYIHIMEQFIKDDIRGGCRSKKILASVIPHCSASNDLFTSAGMVWMYTGKTTLRDDPSRQHFNYVRVPARVSLHLYILRAVNTLYLAVGQACLWVYCFCSCVPLIRFIPVSLLPKVCLCVRGGGGLRGG
jgi:hypothetical protein